MKKILMILMLVSLPSSAFAEVCSSKATGLTISSTATLGTLTHGWLQWLNRPYKFSCIGSTSITCSYGGEVYDFYKVCNNGACVIKVYDAAGLRNVAPLGSGTTWLWDGGPKSGRVTKTCVAWFGGLYDAAHCIAWVYGTCD